MKKREKLQKHQIKELEEIISNKESSSKEVKRAQAVLMIDQGIDFKVIGQLTGYGLRYAYYLRKRYLDHGFEGIKDKVKNKVKALLTKRQRDEIVHVLRTQTPKDYGYRREVWTTDILAELIKCSYGVVYKSKTSYYLLFKEAKFSYHKPGQVYRNREEQEVQEWTKRTKPLIGKAFTEKDTIILVADEMVLSTQTTFQKVWLPKNDYPKIEVSNKRENRSVYGFLNVKSGRAHAFKTERQNMYITRDVLIKVRALYPEKKILLLWDNAGWHRGSVVQQFIQEDQNIETIYFPRYAPEVNPQEHVWKKARSKVTHNRFIENIDKAADEFIEYINKTNCNYSLLGYGALS